MGACLNGPMDLFPLNQLGVMKDVNGEQLYICHPVISAHKHVTQVCHLVNGSAFLHPKFLGDVHPGINWDTEFPSTNKTQDVAVSLISI